MSTLLKTTALIFACVLFSVFSSMFFVGGGSLGAVITQISGSDQLSDLDTLINTVSSELNTAKLDNSDYYATTTHATITSIPNLATVGTVGSGTWQGSTIGEVYGGTGKSTYTTGDILYSDSANSLAKLAVGSNGETLQVSGGVPVWQSGTVDQTQDYTWTGDHLWQAGASTTQFSVFDMAWFGGTATTTISSNGNLDVGGSLSIQGNVLAKASSTTFTSSGTYNKSAGVKRVHVQAWGAGGGGGATNDDANSSAGGGGGEYTEQWLDASDVGASETVTIGSGGSSVSSGSGNNGGNSSFGSLVVASGGSGGDGDGTSETGGDGGESSSFSNTAFYGDGVSESAGGSGFYSGAGGGSTGSGASDGGNSEYGGAGGGGADFNQDDGSTSGSGGTSTYGGAGGNGTDGGNGVDGSVPGGGGGGATGAGFSSGAGADGQIIVTEFF